MDRIFLDPLACRQEKFAPHLAINQQRQVPVYLHMQLLGKQDWMPPRQDLLVENDN